MQLPELHGNLSCKDFFLYAACDDKYFDEFGIPFINSVKVNAGCDLHLHLYNPRQDQLDFCKNKKISLSYEYVPIELFLDAEKKWKTVPTDEIQKSRYERIVGAMEKSGDQHLIDRLRKTYYACARFVRLNQLINLHDRFFAIDVDAIVRKNIPFINGTDDIYMHSITGKKARVLAGALFCAGYKGVEFLKRYSLVLENHINKDYLYWGVDQDVLPSLVDTVSLGQIPMSYIDWEMRPTSVVWTAKGKRKDLDIFISEKKKYTS